MPPRRVSECSSGQGRPRAGSLAERTFSALLGKLSASSPSLRLKVEPLFFKAPDLAGAAGCRGHRVNGGGFFFPLETGTSCAPHLVGLFKL